jgi:glucan phosphorylase
MWSFIDNKSPIIGITNGVHIPTWADEDMIKAAQGNGDLWNNHMKNKIQLIEFVKSRVNVELKPDVLLVGFSRRATSYKRNSLILTDERIVGHLLGEGKIQLVFSGKSHPFDDAGRKTIEDILSAVKRYPNAVAFLENYDMVVGCVYNNRGEKLSNKKDLNRPNTNSAQEEKAGEAEKPEGQGYTPSTTTALVLENQEWLGTRLPISDAVWVMAVENGHF